MKKIVYSSIITLVVGGVVATTILSNTLFSEKNNKSLENNNQNEEIIQDDIIYEGTVQGYYLNREPEQLFAVSDIVLLVEYQSDISSKIYDRDVYTESEFKINKILKNKTNNKLKDKIVARYLGGIVTVDEFMKSRDEATNAKLGLNELNSKEKSSKKIKLSVEDIGDKSLKENPQRVLFLHYDEKENDYIVISNQYGMISYKNNAAFDINSKQYSSYSFLK